MKSFLYRSLLFFSPFMGLFVVTKLYYATDQGDLRRIAYMPEDKGYRDLFKKEFQRPIRFKKMGSDKMPEKSTCSVLVIGDSFSQQKEIGYHNYLADFDSIDVTYLASPKGFENPMEIVSSIINGDLLDKVSFDYIILQSVERSFALRAKDNNLNLGRQLSFNELMQKGPEAERNGILNTHSEAFPPSELIKFPVYNFLYCLDDNAYFSNVYKVSINKLLFSGNTKGELLFYKSDLVNIEINNDKMAVVKLNDELNNLSKRLNKKGVKLIVLPSPDKLDLYYDFIQNKDDYPRPLFFEYMREMKKDYLYVDTKKILSEAIDKKNDIYFYDDSHWSPWASKSIAGKLGEIIKGNQEPVDNKLSLN
jgi:hypothetical protein